MNTLPDVYGFVMKGELAQACVDREIGRTREIDDESAERIIRALPIDLLDKDLLQSSRKMSHVYMAIAAFENSARKFVQDRLLEEYGADWWDTKVSSAIRTQAEQRKKDEEQNRYHGARGTSMINYTQISDLTTIIQNNEAAFRDYIPSVEWARQIFKSIERSRNVIMHSGELAMNDIQRVGMNIRDWLQQLGG